MPVWGIYIVGDKDTYPRRIDRPSMITSSFPILAQMLVIDGYPIMLPHAFSTSLTFSADFSSFVSF
jgi:hypothetical protein